MQKNNLLPLEFYLQKDVISIARQLLGKVLLSTVNGRLTGGIITETEAYKGSEDRASHAYNNRRTSRTEVMFQEGGIAYIYRCYGIHFLFNIITNLKDIPHAILIRSIEPTHGIDVMQLRRQKLSKLCSGPGALCQALGIDLSYNGISLLKEPLWIEDWGISARNIQCTPRIGVSYAQKDTFLLYRFVLENFKTM